MLNILGLDEEAQTYLTRAAAIGSREPLMFYAAAQQAALDRREPDAEKLLMTAWHMRPIERGDVFAMQLLWQVLRLPSVSNELKIADAAEASFASPSTRPIVVPAGTAADVSGDDLRIRAGGGQLLVHGGAAIAPAGSVVIDAGAWRRDAEREALSRFAEEAPRTTPGALLQPTFRTRCFYTAAALADANRWADVLTLTAALPPHDERVPIALSVIRGKALTKMGRAGELRSLVIDLLSNPALKRKRDAPTMWMIAEMLAAVEEYDGAVKMLDHAKSRDDFPGLEQRVTQLLLEKKLAHGYSVITTAHLDIHYPAEIDTVSIQPLANVIEAEYVRLRSTWFPQTGERRVTVNILSWDDLRQYSGSDYVAGLYTNKVFLPLAGIQQFPPDIVALVTHELAHAFIADATHNLAPRWFHEALASHVEMHEQTNNAFRWYEEKRMISVALLDALANGSPDPEVVSETYAIGESTLRFIESRYGKASIRRMLDAFAAGADTEGRCPRGYRSFRGTARRRRAQMGSDASRAFRGRASHTLRRLSPLGNAAEGTAMISLRLGFAVVFFAVFLVWCWAVIRLLTSRRGGAASSGESWMAGSSIALGVILAAFAYFGVQRGRRHMEAGPVVTCGRIENASPPMPSPSASANHRASFPKTEAAARAPRLGSTTIAAALCTCSTNRSNRSNTSRSPRYLAYAA